MFSPADANTDILAQNSLHYSGLSIEEIKCIKKCTAVSNVETSKHTEGGGGGISCFFLPF